MPTSEGRVLLSKGYGVGAELIEIAERNRRWDVRTIWKKPVLKTKMSNVLISGGYIYGIDDVHLSCVALDTGERRWKKRRRPQIGDGQIMLVGEHILVLSEQGEVIFVAADSREYHEDASFQAIEGLTWNNPALSGKYLLVRNASVAACFELPLLDEFELAATNHEKVDNADAGTRVLP
jgi:outer membrane protein assembly factor BamB